MTDKHTPGPWTAEHHPKGGYGVKTSDFHHWRVAEVMMDGSLDATEAHANARLIAAAPELLNVAEMIIAMKDKGEFEIGDCIMRARAAIKAAKS